MKRIIALLAGFAVVTCILAGCTPDPVQDPEASAPEEITSSASEVVSSEESQSQAVSSQEAPSQTVSSKPVVSQGNPSQFVSSDTTSLVLPDVTDLKDQPHYREELTKRYATYKAKNPKLTNEQIVTRVNIGLDQPYYTGATPTDLSDGVLMVVNKYHYLPENYQPADMELVDKKYWSVGFPVPLYMQKEAKLAFESLCEGGLAEGMTILARSGFRDYAFQKRIYNNYVSMDGREKADTYSARPGYSEHQTGLAMDVCTDTHGYLQFYKTEEAKWVKKNAHTYGFIIRYTEENVSITGYSAEAWHLRYVGVEAATYIHENGITFDEYHARFVAQN